jgi:hypothetical protein
VSCHTLVQRTGQQQRRTFYFIFSPGTFAGRPVFPPDIFTVMLATIQIVR